eukprot:SAG22_NODE_714_length_7722_cov_3.919585_4_plen_530_part_00
MSTFVARRDPTAVDVQLVSAVSSRPVANRVLLHANRSRAMLLFEPIDGPGEYLLYYFPHQFEYQATDSSYAAEFLPYSTDGVDAGWLSDAKASAGRLPAAEVVAWQARTRFDEFTEMEDAADPAEVDALLAGAYSGLLLFPEPRTRPIRMSSRLPQRWLGAGPSISAWFAGETQLGEFFVFQLGVVEQAGLAANITGARAAGSALAAGFRCINLGGVSDLGVRFKQTAVLPAASNSTTPVAALWFGVDTAGLAAVPIAGNHTTTLTLEYVTTGGRETAAIEVVISVRAGSRLESPRALQGPADSWRQTRLAWLDSTAGSNLTPTAGFAPLNVTGHTVLGGGFTLELDSSSGFPAQIRRGDKEMLAGPIAFEIGGRQGVADGITALMARPTLGGPGRAGWGANFTQGGLEVMLTGSADFDGFVDFHIRIADRNNRPVPHAGVSLEIPLHYSVAKFMMGLGRHGGFIPPTDVHWSWASFAAVTGHQVWAGQADAGLRLKLKGSDRNQQLLTDVFPLFLELLFESNRIVSLS